MHGSRNGMERQMQQRTLPAAGSRNLGALFTGPALVIHMLLTFVIAVVGLHTLFDWAHLNSTTGLVGLVRSLSAPFLAPFLGAAPMPRAGVVAAVAYLIVDVALTGAMRRVNPRRRRW
jgi:hypothetical protein